MNVRELIERLSKFDPDTKVVLEYDSHFQDIRAVQPEMILTDAPSWADYPSAQVKKSHLSVNAAEHAASQDSPQERVIAIWGTFP